jgi:hypothetical protein
MQSEFNTEQNKTQLLTCAFCNESYPPGTPKSNHDSLVEHIRECPKHPLKATVQALKELHSAVSKDEIAMKNIKIHLAMNKAAKALEIK